MVYQINSSRITKVVRRSPAEPQDLHKLCEESSARIQKSEEVFSRSLWLRAHFWSASNSICQTVIQRIGSCIQILVSKHMSTYMPMRRMQALVGHKFYPRCRVLRQ